MRPGCFHVSPAASAKRQALAGARAAAARIAAFKAELLVELLIQRVVAACRLHTCFSRPEMVRLRRDTRPYFRDAREKTGALTRGSAPTTHLRDIERASRLLHIEEPDWNTYTHT